MNSLVDFNHAAEPQTLLTMVPGFHLCFQIPIQVADVVPKRRCDVVVTQNQIDITMVHRTKGIFEIEQGKKEWLIFSASSIIGLQYEDVFHDS